MRFIRYSDLTVMPWKNGAGIRRDVVHSKHQNTSSGGGWLISIADLNENAQFSNYPDVTRWFLPISRGRVTLVFDDDGTQLPVELTETSPAHQFSGSSNVRCVLHDGPMKALNVMTHGGTAAVNLERLRLQSSTWLTLPASQEGEASFLIVTDGVCRVKSDVWSGPVAKLNSLVNDSGQPETFELNPLESTEIVIVKIGLKPLETSAPHELSVTG
jgi:environmental stress-induced protein Ves